MGHTIIGVFHHSGDADLAAAYLRDEYALEADELDVIGETEADRLTLPFPDGVQAWALTLLTGGVVSAAGDEDPIGKRWGDKVREGETLVVARTYDPDVAQALARDIRVAGAYRVDLLPH